MVRFTDAIPTTDNYYDLFLTTGWNEEYHFTKNDLEKAVKNSWYTVSVYDFDKLIGFGRLIADGVHHALIVDLIVHPDFRNNGIGSQILDRLVKRCKEHSIRDIQLFAAKNRFGFYEKFGFMKRPFDSPGMQLKNYRDKCNPL